MALLPQLTATINGVLTIVLAIVGIKVTTGQAAPMEDAPANGGDEVEGTAYRMLDSTWTAVSNDQTARPIQTWAPTEDAVKAAFDRAAKIQARNMLMTGRAVVPVKVYGPAPTPPA